MQVTIQWRGLCLHEPQKSYLGLEFSPFLGSRESPSKLLSRQGEETASQCQKNGWSCLPLSFHQIYTDELTEEQFAPVCQHHTTCGFTILQASSVTDQQAGLIHPADIYTDLSKRQGSKTALWDNPQLHQTRHKKKPHPWAKEAWQLEAKPHTPRAEKNNPRQWQHPSIPTKRISLRETSSLLKEKAAGEKTPPILLFQNMGFTLP